MNSKNTYSLLLFLFITVTANAQSLCTGSLGDPVVNITFGSGTNPGSSLPTVVPGASTTLSFVGVTGNPAMPTPIDGQYTITNNVPYNGAWFSGAFDHTSGNGTGYMAFYNSSEQPGEFYSQTINNLCGSTTYEFAAWIANALNPAFIVGVDPNITFNIEQADGTIVATYNTGDIPQNPSFTWKQFGFYFTTPATASTLILKMVNNSPGGLANVGNDLAIDDITFRPCGPTTTASFTTSSIVDSIVVCPGADTTLFGTVSTGYTNPNYLWQSSTDAGVTWSDIPNSNALNLKIKSTGVSTRALYKFRLMVGQGTNVNATNCRVASNLVTLVINPAVQAQITGDDICIGEPEVFLFSATSGAAPFNIKYTNGTTAYTLTGLSNNSGFSIPYPLTDTTTFTLITVTDANGCVDSANVNTVINVNPLPQGGITGNSACSGDSVTLVFTATAGTAPFEVVLFDGTNSTSYYEIQSRTEFKINPLPGSTTITLTSLTDQDGNGCTRTTGFISPDASIIVKPSPQLQFDSLGTICIDQPPFLITQAQETSGLPGNGVFSGAGSDALGNFSPKDAGAGAHTITYTYTANNNCVATDSSAIVIHALPQVNAGNDVITCVGFPVQLNATGASAFVWTPSNLLDDATKSNPIATTDSSTTFIVKGTDSTGCYAYDSMNVVVSANSVAAFQVPNAFTPNGDGINDCFGIRKWGNVTVEYFQIYNRWGQLIFSTKDPSQCWDGTFNGQKQDAGGYPYIIKVKSPCGDITRKGMLVLIR